ncbi:exodeoxyribonuclease VII small subunit [Rhodococcus aerolatus]
MARARQDDPQDDARDATGDGPAPTDGLGYEQARDELVEVVRVLEQGGLGLDESLALWERGEALATRCEQHLAGARTRVEEALARADED